MQKLGALFSSKSVEWYTPKSLFEDLNVLFNFNLDPCATKGSSLCSKFFTSYDDGLAQFWTGYNVFCNPPYGKGVTGKWVKKCFESFDEDTNIVLLIPARTDTIYFHKYIYMKSYVSIIFLKGRVHFSESKMGAPFPVMLVLFSLDHALHSKFINFYYSSLDKNY